MNARSFSVLGAEIKDHNELSKISMTSKMHWNYPKEWLTHWMPELMITRQYINHNNVYKLVVEDEIAGFISIEEEEGVYEIGHLWILPKFIGRGYGKTLLNEAISRVVKPNAEIIVLSDPNAESFYKSQGFKTFDKKESYPKGRYLPLMRKRNII